jgi:hypothetical protein
MSFLVTQACTIPELMVIIDQNNYQKYITIKKGRQNLYLRLQKALYGMMKSAVLFYRKLMKELKEMGFEINPYEVWCKLRWVKNS